MIKFLILYMIKKLAPIAPIVISKKNNKDKLKSGTVVFQSNDLIEAKYHLSLQEKRLILWLISQIKPDDEEFKEHILKIDDFIKIVGLNGESAYHEIQNITKTLIQKALTIKIIDKNEDIQVSWLSSAHYFHGEGIVSLSFSPKMKPLLLNLKKQFTAIKLTDVMQFTSIHAIRIYELLKQYENIGERIMKVEEIKEYCGVKDKLKQYVDFQNKLLLISQREINLKSDIKFSFEKIKSGRRIESICFTISKNKSYELLQNPKQLEKISNNIPLSYQLKDFGLTQRMINKIMQENTTEDIQNAIRSVDLQITRKNVRNPKAMLITAIKEKWHPEKFKPR